MADRSRKGPLHSERAKLWVKVREHGEEKRGEWTDKIPPMTEGTEKVAEYHGDGHTGMCPETLDVFSVTSLQDGV